MKTKSEVFDEIAEIWEKDCALTEAQNNTVNTILDKCIIDKDDVILDVGCGIGTLVPFILDRLGDNGIIKSIDISKGMIEKAKEKYTDNRVKFSVDDIQNKSFSDKMFNKIFMFSVFPHIDDKEKAFDNSYQMLKDKGELVIFHVDSSNYLNNMHSKLENKVLRNDNLPKPDELEKIVDKTKWNLIAKEDKEGLYLFHLIKK